MTADDAGGGGGSTCKVNSANGGGGGLGVFKGSRQLEQQAVDKMQEA